MVLLPSGKEIGSSGDPYRGLSGLDASFSFSVGFCGMIADITEEVCTSMVVF